MLITEKEAGFCYVLLQVTDFYYEPYLKGFSPLKLNMLIFMLLLLAIINF